jgi:hypothetical protein
LESVIQKRREGNLPIRLISAFPTFLKTEYVDVLLKLVTKAARIAIITVKTINVLSKRSQGNLALIAISASPTNVPQEDVNVLVKLVTLAANPTNTVTRHV